MMQIPTGIECIDRIFEGGIPATSISLVYGEPETGKSTLMLQTAVYCALQNKKVLYVDCDNTFSTKRLYQIAGKHFEEVADKIVLIKPATFKEQTTLINRLEEYTASVGLIIIDTITSLYSARAAETPKAFSVNRELNCQLAILAQIVKTKKIPLFITSEVRCVITDDAPSVKPVATRVLKFWADNIFFLKPSETPPTIKLTIEKTAPTAAPTVCYIQIVEAGIKDTQIP